MFFCEHGFECGAYTSTLSHQSFFQCLLVVVACACTSPPCWRRDDHCDKKNYNSSSAPVIPTATGSSPPLAHSQPTTLNKHSLALPDAAAAAADATAVVKQPLREGAEDEVVGELLIPVSRLPQNEPVEQWYGLEPPVGSGKTFTKAALLLRFLFTSSSSPDAADAAAATAGGAGKGDSAAPAGSQRQSVAVLAHAEDGAAGVGGSRAGSPGGGAGAGKPGLGAGNESFRQALLMAGVTPEGAGGGGSNADSAGVRRTDFPGGGGAKRGDEFSVDSSIDPFGADEIEGDEYLGGGGGDSEAARAAQRGELSLLHSQQQLQLGSWGGSNVGTAVLPVGFVFDSRRRGGGRKAWQLCFAGVSTCYADEANVTLQQTHSLPTLFFECHIHEPCPCHTRSPAVARGKDD